MPHLGDAHAHKYVTYFFFFGGKNFYFIAVPKIVGGRERICVVLGCCLQEIDEGPRSIDLPAGTASRN